MGEAFTFFVPHPPAWLASVVVRPYHVAQKLEHLFIKDNNDTNILTVKFSLHFTQKYYAVHIESKLRLKTLRLKLKFADVNMMGQEPLLL